MNKHSWVATTGLCVLLAASAAEAHLIPICVDAYDSGTRVSGVVAGATLSHVTFTQAGPQSPAVRQKAGAPYWSAGSGSISNCVHRTYSYSASDSQQSQEMSVDSAARSTGAAFQVAGDGNGLVPTLVQAFNQALGQHAMASFDQATDLVRFDSGSSTHSPLAWGFDAGGNGSALTPGHLSNQARSQLGRSGSGGGNISRVPSAGNHDSIGDNANAADVPEPETLALLMVGLLGMALTARQRRERIAGKTLELR